MAMEIFGDHPLVGSAHATSREMPNAFIGEEDLQAYQRTSPATSHDLHRTGDILIEAGQKLFCFQFSEIFLVDDPTTGAIIHAAFSVHTAANSQIIEDIKKNEPAIRLAFRDEIARLAHDNLETGEGVSKLLSRLKTRTNNILIEQGGIGEVHDVQGEPILII